MGWFVDGVWTVVEQHGWTLLFVLMELYVAHDVLELAHKVPVRNCAVFNYCRRSSAGVKHSEGH